MLNPERPETKEFIEQFVSSPIQCSKVCERLDLVFPDKGDNIAFYLYPAKEYAKNKFQIHVKRVAKNNVWSFVIIEHGKANQNTYKNNLNVAQTLKAILDVLEEEGEATYGC